MNKYVQVEGGSMPGKVMSLSGRCDLCGKVNLPELVDGATRMGPWANMCEPCFRKAGVGLGMGRGQRYVEQAIVSGSLSVNATFDAIREAGCSVSRQDGEWKVWLSNRIESAYFTEDNSDAVQTARAMAARHDRPSVAVATIGPRRKY